jgi:hypothetical protein
LKLSLSALLDWRMLRWLFRHHLLRHLLCLLLLAK